MAFKQQLKYSEYTLKPNEVKKIIYSTKNFRDRCLIKTLYSQGLRRNEARNLDIRDIDFERTRMTVRLGKGGKTRIIPITEEEYLSDLKHLIGKKTEGYLFISERNDKLSNAMVNKIVKQAGEKAEIKHPNPAMKHINPHIFRHSIARHMKDNGYSIEFIQKFLGHSSYKTTTDLYGTMSIDDMQAMVEKKRGIKNND